MLNSQDVQKLVEFTSDDPLVLSLYLDVDSTHRTKEEYRITLRNVLRQAHELASSKDIQAVERYFDFEYDGMARGVILFTCQEREFWHVFAIQVAVEDRIVVARRPYVTPLRDILDEYARYGVVLVDREGALLFLFHLGELQEVEGTLGDELKRHKQGGRAAQRLQRKADGTAHQNLKEVVSLTKSFFKEHGANRLVLAGIAENVTVFRAMLPKALQSSVVGEIAIDMSAGEVDVRDRTMEVIQAHIRQEDAGLVEQMVTAARKGEAGVLGLADTLNALQQERVHILLVSEGFEQAGARCLHCGYLAAQPLKSCPYCGKEMRAADHVIDSAVRLAIERGVGVKIITDNQQLKEAGQIGAILRY